MPFSTTDLLFALPWILVALLGHVLVRRRPQLRDEQAPADAPLISVIVPARNEADNISGITATLLSSEYPNYEIVLVDDGSTDGTTDIVNLLAENHPDRIRAVHGKTLPEGWVGKCWACWQGYEQARGEVLVFTDADTRHHPRLLGHTVGALRRHRADLVTVFPRQLVFSFWERVIQPHIFAAIQWRYPDPERVNRTGNPRNVIANGQFMAFPRESYAHLGGHKAVRDEVVEDLALAQLIASKRMKIYLAYAHDLIATRMYRDLPGIIEGWSKNLANASRQTVPPWLRPVLPWLIAAFLILFWIVPAVLLIVSPVFRPVRFGWSLAVVLASLAYWLVTYRRFSIPVITAGLYPLGALMTAALFIRSALLGDSVIWRGRLYGTDQEGPAVAAPETAGRPE